MDLSWTPQDIWYLTDTRLLHEACQKLGGMMQVARTTEKPWSYSLEGQ